MIDVFFAFDPTLLAAFIAAGLLLNITPGADFVFVTASAIAGGPRIGISAALGINTGVAVHILLAAAGVSALLMAYPAAYDAIRYLGAAYLLWLAVQAWRADATLNKGTAAVSPLRAIKRGFVTNVLNPKTALFIFAFIPQFTDPSHGPMWMQILILGAIFLLFGMMFSLLIGVFAGLIADRLRKKVHILNKITAVMFAGLAARLTIN